MLKALFIFLLLPGACLRAEDAAAEVGKADKLYRQAMNSGDVVVLESLITDDFLFIRRTGEIWDKKAFLENAKGRKLDVEEKDLKTRIYGDIIILTHMDSVKTAEGTVIKMIATRVFVRQRGFWKLASVQDTALPSR